MASKRLPRIRRLIVLLLALGLLSSSSLLEAKKKDSGRTADLESSVVKVYVNSSPPDLLSPWQKAGIELATGSGVVIEGQRILTNAHVVVDAVSIEVKRSNMSQRYVAEIDHIDHDCDLALLRVDEESFFEGVQPVALGEEPEAQTAVEAYGFPIGGEAISVTSGIISRIEMNTYVHSMEDLLMAQIDAAINSGNSGGPVLAGDRLVGIATQAMDDAENVGYMIPVSVVRQFLRDVQDGVVQGIPKLGIINQELDSPALRRSLGMTGSQTGTVVTWVDHGSPADGTLEPRDVLMEIDGVPIANDMTVSIPRIGRVDYSYVYQSKQIGEQVSVKILREGAVLERKLTLTPHRDLVPGRRLADAPQYLVFGGLLFQPLTVDYLVYFEEVPDDLGNFYHYANRVTQDRQQIILLQKVLPHPVNRGYQSWEDYVIESVDGEIPHDMQHLAEILGEAQGPFVRVVTMDKSFLTLELEAARAARPTILSNFGIAHDRSPDLRVSEVANGAR